MQITIPPVLAAAIQHESAALQVDPAQHALLMLHRGYAGTIRQLQLQQDRQEREARAQALQQKREDRKIEAEILGINKRMAREEAKKEIQEDKERTACYLAGTIEQWLSDNTIPTLTPYISAGRAYADFSTWCSKNRRGDVPTLTRFGMLIAEAGILKSRDGGGIRYAFKLRPQEEE